jgi:hypothetical protein
MLTRTNDAPLLTTYSSNLRNIQFVNWKISLKISYDPKRCCTILLYKNVCKESHKKYFIFKSFRNHLRVC